MFGRRSPTPSPKDFFNLFKQLIGFHNPYEFYDVQFSLLFFRRDGLPSHRLWPFALFQRQLTDIS